MNVELEYTLADSTIRGYSNVYVELLKTEMTNYIRNTIKIILTEIFVLKK